MREGGLKVPKTSFFAYISLIIIFLKKIMNQKMFSTKFSVRNVLYIFFFLYEVLCATYKKPKMTIFLK